MKKRITVCAILGVICVAICVCMLTGCSNLTYIESSEFKRQIELNNMQTLYWSEYIGQADGKAFILRKRVPLIGKKMKEEVLFTEADQLGEEFIKKLKEGISNQKVDHISKGSNTSL